MYQKIDEFDYKGLVTKQYPEQDPKSIVVATISKGIVKVFKDRLQKTFNDKQNLAIVCVHDWSKDDTGGYKYNFTNARVKIISNSVLKAYIDETPDDMNYRVSILVGFNDTPPEDVAKRNEADMNESFDKLTKREFVSILLKHPNSGNDWIDDMIRKSLNIS